MKQGQAIPSKHKRFSDADVYSVFTEEVRDAVPLMM